MNQKNTLEIFSTLKKLSEDKKQMINNYVRETFGRPNVAIWAVKSDLKEQEELCRQIDTALQSDDWGAFQIGSPFGKTRTAEADPKPDPPLGIENSVGDCRETGGDAKDVEPVSSSFGDQIRQLVDAEVNRRVADVRAGVRAKVIAELGQCQ